MASDIQRFNQKHKKLIMAAAVAAYVLLVLVIAWRIGGPLIKFVEEPERFRAWLDAKGVWGRISFVGMVVLQVVAAIIPGEPFEIGAGYAFGAVEGTLLCIAGAAIGSVLVFAFVRRFGMRLVEVFFTGDKIRALLFLRDSPKRRALMWLLFTVPGTPKDLLCYFAGLTDIKWSEWLLMSIVARIPSIITSTMGGDALGLEKYWPAVIIFAATLAVSLGGLLIYRAICRRNEKK